MKKIRSIFAMVMTFCLIFTAVSAFAEKSLEGDANVDQRNYPSTTPFINMGSDNLISLTDQGYAIARKIYDRHRTLTKYLIQLGVPDEIAKADACRIEHDLSDESFEAIRGQTGQ